MEHMDFCIAQDALDCVPVTCDAIYYVFAGSDYRVTHRPMGDSYVLAATLGGNGSLLPHRRLLQMGAGDVLLFKADTPFVYQCEGVGWNFWWFEFRCHAPGFLEIPLETVFHAPLGQHQIFLCEEALNALKLRDGKTAAALLSSLLRLMKARGPGALPAPRGYALFRQADQYIRKNLDTVTVEGAARHLGVSPRTLLKLFRALLGIRTVEYIQNVKLDMARYLLKTGDSSLREIAAFLGYADPFVLSKCIRKRFGAPPSRLRDPESRSRPE